MATFPSPERTDDQREVEPYQVTVGVLTALPVELLAVERLMDDPRPYRDRGDQNLYRVGTMPSTEGARPRHIALLMMPRDGTQLAATCCANLLRTFPNIQTVVMTGIAGGIPRPSQPDKHVRLGDIVVAVDGIVNYGSVRREDGTIRLRGRQGAGLISSWLRQAVRELRVEEEAGRRRWEGLLDPDRSTEATSYPRPAAATDILYVRHSVTAHPARPEPGPPENMPRGQRTAPELETPPERLNTAAQAYHHLAELNADTSGLDPAIVFLAHLVEEVRDRDSDLAERLWKWIEDYTDREGTKEALRARLQPGPDAGRPTSGTGPRLLLEIGVDGIDRNRFRVASYLQETDGPWRPRLTREQHVKREEIEKAVSGSIAEAEEVWAQRNTTGQARIEFLLPWSLMNERVQWYPASPRLGQVDPICVRYPVAVRSRERMREPTIRREWARRWERLDQQPFTGAVQWGTHFQSPPIGVDSWKTGLSGDDSSVVVVLSAPPSTEIGRRELMAALAAGVPVVLWDQRSTHPPKAAVDGLHRLLVEPARLPAQTRAARVEAAQVADKEPDHYGQSVALLWDDPTRVVGAGSAES